MDTKTLQSIGNDYWAIYCETFPKLVRFDPPTIIINNRYTRCVGACYYDRNLIQISGKFLAKFGEIIITDTLPHEMAHQIDFNLNGWFKGKHHHGASWIKIMVQLGLEPEAYSTLKL